MELRFTIRPGISPLDRGEIEDRVVEALNGDAEVLGGGGMLDGSLSDFQLEVHGFTDEEAIERCTAVFAQIAFSMPTRVDLELDDRVISLPTAIADDV